MLKKSLKLFLLIFWTGLAFLSLLDHWDSLESIPILQYIRHFSREKWHVWVKKNIHLVCLFVAFSTTNTISKKEITKHLRKLVSLLLWDMCWERRSSFKQSCWNHSCHHFCLSFCDDDGGCIFNFVSFIILWVVNWSGYSKNALRFSYSKNGIEKMKIIKYNIM